MSRYDDKDASKKIDVILGGMETIGSAERSTDVDMMRDTFHTITNGEYSKLLFNLFGKDRVEAELEKANIIVNRQLIPGDIKAGRNYFHPGGIRLGVSEITRLGMKENEMKEIATFIKQIIIEKKDPKKILPKVKSWRKDYQKVKYCFDKKLGAYEYVKLR